MTRFGSRFLEKGRRSGSCLDVHSSMAHYCIRTRPQERLSGRSGAQIRCLWMGTAAGGREAVVKQTEMFWAANVVLVCSDKHPRPERRNTAEREQKAAADRASGEYK